MRAGYLGPAGTFSHEALLASAPVREALALPTVHDAVRAVQEGRVDRSLVPIENSLEGGVGATLDALVDHEEVAIVGEVVRRISHCLIAADPVALEEIRTISSHPQAAAQCAGFLRERLPAATVDPAPSTAEAVRLVAEGGAGAAAAAIGTRGAAALYGCVVLAEGIEDVAGNATRFVWVARRQEAAPGGEDGPHRTSVVWWGGGDARPGWLVRCLSEFAFRGVNLTRIESRPRRHGLGHYMFFADLEGAAADAPVADAIDGLRAHAQNVRLLGSYPASASAPEA